MPLATFLLLEYVTHEQLKHEHEFGEENSNYLKKVIVKKILPLNLYTLDMLSCASVCIMHYL